MMRRPTWLYAIGAIILAFGLYLVVPDRAVCSPDRAIKKLEQTCEVSYRGVEGKNALEILKETHQVETQSFSFGEMVQSIDGVKAPATHFWAFYVNDELAQVGAGDYQTKPTDTLKWKLEAITLTQ